MEAAIIHYFLNDPISDLCWDCEDDMEELIGAWYSLVRGGPWNHGEGLVWRIDRNGDGSAVSHFFGGAEWKGIASVETQHKIFGKLSSGQQGDWQEDTAFAYVGADFSDLLDTWTEAECRRIVAHFADGRVNLSDLFGGVHLTLVDPTSLRKGIVTDAGDEWIGSFQIPYHRLTMEMEEHGCTDSM